MDELHLPLRILQINYVKVIRHLITAVVSVPVPIFKLCFLLDLLKLLVDFSLLILGCLSPKILCQRYCN